MQVINRRRAIASALKLHANRSSEPFPAQNDLSSDVSTGSLKFENLFVYLSHFELPSSSTEPKCKESLHEQRREAYAVRQKQRSDFGRGMEIGV
jgi:hypothetical protein